MIHFDLCDRKIFVYQATIHGVRGEKLPLRTSIDLELDLQASKTRQAHLNDEITRLRDLKSLLEDAKSRGMMHFCILNPIPTCPPQLRDSRLRDLKSLLEDAKSCTHVQSDMTP